MSLNGLFYLLLLDTDIALGHSGGGMLKKLLDKSNIIAAVFINLGSVEFAEAVGGDALIAQVIAHQF